MERCKDRVQWKGPGFGRFSQCKNSAKRDGFCMIHHPSAYERREEKANDLFLKNRKKRMAQFMAKLRAKGRRKQNKIKGADNA